MHNILIIALLLAPLGCYSSKDWSGHYIFEAELGEDASGMPMIIEYDLKLSSESCELVIQGYQVNEQIICDADIKQNTAEIAFKSSMNGSLKNIYDVQVYKVKSVRFKLKQSKGGFLITKWESLMPDEPLPIEGYFFKEAKNN